jgi:hypothetical protein
MSVEDMHVFGESFEEFLSPEDFSACAHSPVRILQLTHFDSRRPEHMNMIMAPGRKTIFVVGADHKWVPVEYTDALLKAMMAVVARIKHACPSSPHAKHDEVSICDVNKRIMLGAIAGLEAMSPVSACTLHALGVELPPELVPYTKSL